MEFSSNMDYCYRIQLRSFCPFFKYFFPEIVLLQNLILIKYLFIKLEIIRQ